MANLNYTQMFFAVRKRFPQLEVKCSSKFSEEYEPNTSLWLKNASSVQYTDKDTNPLSALDNCIYESKHYEIDVYKKFEKWCNKKGWYASTESYTLQLFKL